MCARCFILLFFAYFKVIADCFYILDVGQGNCQLAIFEKEKIGVLYDCGTSSTKKPRKLISKGSPEPDKLIYEVEKHVKRKDSTSSVDVSELIDEDDQVDEEKSSENSQSMSDSQKRL